MLSELFLLWERSVRATHLFLSDAEIRDIAAVVPDALQNVPRLAGAFGVQEVCVNEQNPQAVGFYAHEGFFPYKRTETDEAECPYPLLYMKRQ